MEEDGQPHPVQVMGQTGDGLAGRYQSDPEDQNLFRGIQVPLEDGVDRPETPTGRKATKSPSISATMVSPKVNKVYPSPDESPKAAPIDEPTRGLHKEQSPFSSEKSQLSSSPTEVREGSEREKVSRREVPTNGNGNGAMRDGGTPAPIDTPSSPSMPVNSIMEWSKSDANGDTVKHRSLAKPSLITKQISYTSSESEFFLSRKSITTANPRGKMVGWMSRIAGGGRGLTEAAWGAYEVKGILISIERKLEREYNPELKVRCLPCGEQSSRKMVAGQYLTLPCCSAVCDAAGSTSCCPRPRKAGESWRSNLRASSFNSGRHAWSSP